jgi:hypothetical protein
MDSNVNQALDPVDKSKIKSKHFSAIRASRIVIPNTDHDETTRSGGFFSSELEG